MSLKYKLTADQFTALAEALKGEYKKLDDGTYQLDVSDLEDTGALKRAKDHEKAERKRIQDALNDLELKHKELEAEYSEYRTKGGSKVADVEKAWQDKFAKREKELLAQIDTTKAALRNTMEDSVANQLASKLAGDNGHLLLPHIRTRLRAEVQGDKVVTKVLGEDGDVSALTTEELANEILTSPKFAAVVIGSKASGGGAGGRKGAGGTTKKLSEMSATEEAQFANKHPDEYKRMLQAEGQSE